MAAPSANFVPYDDRDGWIWLDGVMVPWRDAKIHVLTHSLHYGSCVFEGERAYEGRVFRSTDHSRRLHKARRCASPARSTRRAWIRTRWRCSTSRGW